MIYPTIIAKEMNYFVFFFEIYLASQDIADKLQQQNIYI